MTEFAEESFRAESTEFAEVLHCFAGLPYVSGLAALIVTDQRGWTGPEDAATALIGGVLMLHGRAVVLGARATPGFPYADLTDAELLERARIAWAKAGTRDRRKK